MKTVSVMRNMYVKKLDNRGSIAMVWAFILPVIIGGLALGLDVGLWQFNKRDLQSATDASTYTTGFELPADPDNADLQSYVEAEMDRNGFGTADGVTITVSHPPVSGTQVGNTAAVEVVATMDGTLGFSQYFVSVEPTLTARAVAMREAGGQACVMALDSFESDALAAGGTATVNLDCAAASNSNSDTAISISGNADFTATTIYTPGNYSVSGSATLTTTDTAPITGGAPLVDPYEGLEVPPYAGCDHNNEIVMGTTTISPGVFCNGLRINAGAVVTMDPGVYIIDRGSFVVNGSATLTGTDVTIILTSSTGSNHADVTINGGAVLDIAAPTTGDYAGVAFYQDQDAVSGSTNRFNGGSTMAIQGTLYFPSQTVQFTGGNTTGGAGTCTQVIASIVSFSGNADLSSNCAGTGIEWLQYYGDVKLVE